MASKSIKTTLFDLPLELHKLTYEQLFPRSTTPPFNNYEHYSPKPSTIEATCAADQRIAVELRDWEIIRYTSCRFVVSPGMWSGPETFEHKNLCSVDIFIKHWDSSNFNCYDDEHQIRMRRHRRVSDMR